MILEPFFTQSPHPFTGFGDDPNWSVKFHVLVEGGAAPDWESGLRMAQLTPATGNGLISQRRGRDPWQISLRLWLSGVDDLYRLDAMTGRRATLRYAWGVTKTLGLLSETIQNASYHKLPATMLIGLDKVAIEGDGTLEVTATFQRPYVDPAPFTPPTWPPAPSPSPLPEPLLFLSPSLMRTRAGAVSPAIAGAVRTVTTDDAPAWLPLPGTTNLCPNPIFGISASGWGAAIGTIARTTGWAYTGTASGLLTASGANAEASFAVTVPASAYVLSAYVRNNAAGSRTAQLRYNGANVGAAVTIPAGGEAVLEGQVTGTGASGTAGVRLTNSANGETFNLGHYQVEPKGGFEGRTPFCPMYTVGGSLETGDAWTGTPHASTSTRTMGTIALPLSSIPGISSLAGTAYVLARRGTARHDGSLLEIGSRSSGQDVFVVRSSPDATGAMVMGGAVNLSWAEDNYTVYPNTQTWRYLLDWDGTSIRDRRADGSLHAMTRATPTGTITGNLELGAHGSNAWGAEILALIVYDRRLTDPERARLDSILPAHLAWSM